MYVRPFRNDSEQDRALGQALSLAQGCGCPKERSPPSAPITPPCWHLSQGPSASPVQSEGASPGQETDVQVLARQDVRGQREGSRKSWKVLKSSRRFWRVLDGSGNLYPSFWLPPHPQYIPKIGPPFQGWIPKSGEEGQGHGPRQTLFCLLCLWPLAFRVARTLHTPRLGVGPPGPSGNKAHTHTHTHKCKPHCAHTQTLTMCKCTSMHACAHTQTHTPPTEGDQSVNTVSLLPSTNRGRPYLCQANWGPRMGTWGRGTLPGGCLQILGTQRSLQAHQGTLRSALRAQRWAHR